MFKNPKNRRQRRSRDQVAAKVHVGEMYSPPRMVLASERLGMKAALSLDLIVLDDEGEPWDFTVPARKAKAMSLLKEDCPALLVVSPMCGPFHVAGTELRQEVRRRDQRAASPSAGALAVRTGPLL